MMSTTSRRAVLMACATAGLALVPAACSAGGGTDSGAASAASAAPDVTATERATAPASGWRNATAVPVEPDGPSRAVTPVSTSGDTVLVDGASLTVPTGSEVTQDTNTAGLPRTVVRLPGGVNGLPAVSVTRVDSFGRDLVDETYAQEVELVGQGQVNQSVTRSAETWPGSDEAYLITWSSSVTLKDGSSMPIDCLGFWVSDGDGGGWVVYATTGAGDLAPGSAAWNAAFSLEVTG